MNAEGYYQLICAGVALAATVTAYCINEYRSRKVNCILKKAHKNLIQLNELSTQLKCSVNNLEGMVI